MALGVLHLVSTAVLSAKYVDAWVRGDLWLPEGGPTEISPAVGAFWLSLGSFGLPLLLLGGMVTWSASVGRTPPAYVGWGIAGWATICALILEPSPFILALVPAAMLIRAARRPEGHQASRPQPSERPTVVEHESDRAVAGRLTALNSRDEEPSRRDSSRRADADPDL